MMVVAVDTTTAGTMVADTTKHLVIGFTKFA